MARQRAYTKDELLDATEKLIIERGYEGFHLTALAEEIQGARSTIYEYFANKEEIVAACMRRKMDRVLESIGNIHSLEPVEAIKKLVSIFMEHAHFRTLVLAAPNKEQVASKRAKEDLHALEQSHEQLKQLMTRLFARAQEAGELRSDIPLPMIVAVFFHAVETPNWLGLPHQQFAEMLFDLWWNGGST